MCKRGAEKSNPEKGFLPLMYNAPPSNANNSSSGKQNTGASMPAGEGGGGQYVAEVETGLTSARSNSPAGSLSPLPRGMLPIDSYSAGSTPILDKHSSNPQL